LLKASALAALIWLVFATPPALANSLLTGSVRDVHGAPVEGASVSGLDAGAHVIGRSTTSPDGTFALETASRPDSVRISCRFCRSVTITVKPDEPVVAILRRYDALLVDGPSAADFAALPYSRIENALALTPFEVLRASPATAIAPSLSDRALDYSALVLDGAAPTYSYTFGNPAGLSTTPAHGGAAVAFEPPSEAYQYGAYASGGTLVLSRNPMQIEQAAFGDASGFWISAATPSAGVSVAGDADDISQRERAVISGATPLLGGTLDGMFSMARADTALEYGAFDISSDAATLGYSRNFDRVQFHFTAADSFGTDAMNTIGSVWNDDALHSDLSTRVGLVDVSLGDTYVNASTTTTGNVRTYAQNTVYAAARMQLPSTSVNLGVAQTQTQYDGNIRTNVLPSLVVTQSFGQFALSGGLSDSVKTITGYSNDVVAGLAELHLRYSDDRRLRLEIQTYNQATNQTGNPNMSGTGGSIEYQITPTTTIRAWTLRVYNDYYGVNPPAGIQPYVSGDTLWITNQNGGFRFDVVYRRTASVIYAYETPYTNTRGVDGDIYFPLTAKTSLGFRSELRPQGRRSSVVLTLLP
jgi:hypothetical protein